MNIVRMLALVGATTVATFSWAATGVTVGASGKTYASAGVQCALNPVSGMAPMVQAGLYNPGKKATATVWLNAVAVAKVTFVSPDATVWLPAGINTVAVMLNRRTVDRYVFDTTTDYPEQPNICIPDTRANTVSGEIETGANAMSYASVTPGCAFNPLAGRPQPFVNLFDNGSYLLNVSINNVPLTQLNGTSRTRTPVFLSPGLNVISAASPSATDYFVRDGGDGTCVLPQ